ncbi:MAG TPA: Ig-like domain repeat protein, partial [Verrucomicrobiae bacterium]|nr:Ig-like domain repeat protein [Verrucomicrobiae bacterium]
PTVTAGNVQAGDTANFIESYTNKNVGTGKILTPSGTVTDGNSGNNYSYTFASTANGTITQASASVLMISSENPSGYKDSVFFTATNLPSDATGNAIFLTNGVTFSTNSLTSGSAASLSVTNLPRGTNTVTVQYAGDGNYLGSTNNLAGGQVVTNHPPTATAYNVSRTAGLNLLITISNLTNQWNDVDGDTVAMNWINLVTTNGVTVRTNSSLILYTNNLNVNDQITYVINDGQGGTNTGVINVTVNPFVTGQQTSTPLSVSGGSVTATFFGIPTYIYEVQRSTNLNAGIGWVNISTNTVGSGGTFSITDQFSDLGGHIPSSAYYRLEWHP